MNTSFSIATPTLVFAWPEKDDFDRLAVAETLYDWEPDRSWTALKNDGQSWERRCHSKTIQGSGVIVIFQWFDERPLTRDPGTDGGAS